MKKPLLVLEYDVNPNSGLRVLSSVSLVQDIGFLCAFFKKKIQNFEDTLKSAHRIVQKETVQSVFTVSSLQGTYSSEELVDFVSQWFSFSSPKFYVTFSFRSNEKEAVQVKYTEFIVLNWGLGNLDEEVQEINFG